VDLIWAGLDSVDRIFLICTAFGGILFVTRMVMGLFTGGGDDGELGDGDVEVHDADISFKVLTVQGITAFFLVFGLSGLALSRGSQVEAGYAIMGAFVAGVAIMTIIAKLTQMMKGLHMTGNLDIRRAVGQKGIVYLNIPASGTGQAQVSIQNRLRVMDARAEDKKSIKTGEPIEVTDVIDGQTLIVRKLEIGAEGKKNPS